ncbi:hypothetical protein PROFUN_00810 [Planoprotostelium fungivorum]|uniref:Uncharacterized protein n=1 Tax=Planoprotostelium fungivorum TaxID=1890364 RepID=A0A2P6P018_9EUKA|nr:hypothetical protein PROFUN_00810 [Planoprotostelium fungivorum]
MYGRQNPAFKSHQPKSLTEMWASQKNTKNGAWVASDVTQSLKSTDVQQDQLKAKRQIQLGFREAPEEEKRRTMDHEAQWLQSTWLRVNTTSPYKMRSFTATYKMKSFKLLELVYYYTSSVFCSFPQNYCSPWKNGCLMLL